MATIENNLRFPGQYYDKETGLSYNWNRYYEPDTGRYLATDPIGLEGGINLFVYGANNPMILIDATGEIVYCTYYVRSRQLVCSTQTYGIMICAAKSGNNNPADQCVPDKGPIPTGRWRIGRPDYRNWAPLTEVYGSNTNCQCNPDRFKIYIHGWGTTTGCIAIKSPKCRDRLMDSLKKEKGGDLTVTEQ